MDTQEGQQGQRNTRVIGAGMVTLVGVLVVLWTLVYGAIALGAIRAINPSDLAEGAALIRSRGSGLLARSVLIAGGIGFLATLLGIPIARIMMNTRRRWVWIMALIPLWIPTYAIYGSMNLARAPDTLVGRALINYSTSQPERRWATIYTGYAIGIVGLSLWGSVIASLVIASSAGKRSTIYQDMMDLEPAGCVVRARMWIGIHRAALLRAWGVVAIVMLGSGVPLHLAQLDTWSITIWRQLAERGFNEWGVVWVLGSPMVLAGMLGAWFVTRVVVKNATSRGMDEGPGIAPRSDHRIGRLGWISALSIWSVAVLIPMLVLAVSIDDRRSIGVFWSERSSAITHSVSVGAIVGLIACFYALGIACTLGSSSRWVRRVGLISVFLSTAGALVPGVLVGASFAQLIGWIGSSAGAIGEVLGLSARVLVVAAVIGAIIAGRESGELLSQRWSIGGGLKSWWNAHGRTGAAACVGAGILCGLLAIHEIEASVMITRAGVSTLSQTLLADLHYARLERLSAALLNLMALALLISMFAGWFLSRGSSDD